MIRIRLFIKLWCVGLVVGSLFFTTPESLARIFHGSYSEAKEKADETRRRQGFDQGCMSPYRSDQNSTTTQYSSALAELQTERLEISGLGSDLNLEYHAPIATGAATLPSINENTPASKILGESIALIFNANFNAPDQQLLLEKNTAPGLPLNSINEYGNSFNFAALLGNGGVVAWSVYDINNPAFPVIPYGKKVVSVTSNEQNFSMLFDDGSVGFWDVTGNSTMTELELPEGTKAVSIFSNRQAFVALLDNGRVFCWGDADHGGATPFISKGRRVKSIIANDHAFVAILDDGTIQCWGDPTSGGLMPASLEGKVVSAIVPSAYAFAAVLDDGSLQCWGDDFLGGKLPTSFPQNKKIKSIIANVNAFAVLFKDGSVQCWGDTLSGGATPTINNGEKILSIFASGYAFTALLDGGELQSWGDPSSGGAVPKLSNLHCLSCAASFYSFTAMLTNHVACYWGLHAQEGKTVILPNKNIVSVAASGNAFTALFDDGTIQSWGDIYSGGITPDLAGRKVKSLVSNFQGFLALLDNGQLHAWGGRIGSLGEVHLFDQEVKVAEGKNAVALVSPLNKVRFYQTDQLIGVAVVQNNSAHGEWQYLDHGSAEWKTIPTINGDRQAFLIRSDSKVRFVPAQNFYGTSSPLKVRLIGLGAEVQTGSHANVTLHGDGTAYSDGVISLTTTIKKTSQWWWPWG